MAPQVRSGAHGHPRSLAQTIYMDPAVRQITRSLNSTKPSNNMSPARNVILRPVRFADVEEHPEPRIPTPGKYTPRTNAMVARVSGAKRAVSVGISSTPWRQRRLPDVAEPGAAAFVFARGARGAAADESSDHVQPDAGP